MAKGDSSLSGRALDTKILWGRTADEAKNWKLQFIKGVERLSDIIKEDDSLTKQNDVMNPRQLWGYLDCLASVYPF